MPEVVASAATREKSQAKGLLYMARKSFRCRVGVFACDFDSQGGFFSNLLLLLGHKILELLDIAAQGVSM